MSDQLVILLVEDSEEDILLMRRALLVANIVNPLQVVRSGEEALDYLSGTGRYTNRAEFPLPGIVLLDLKMPGTDGFEVLSWIRRSPDLGGLLVIVLTSSNHMDHVTRAYEIGANSFLVKPVIFEQFVSATMALNYWLGLDRSADESESDGTSLLAAQKSKPTRGPCPP